MGILYRRVARARVGREFRCVLGAHFGAEQRVRRYEWNLEFVWS